MLCSRSRDEQSSETFVLPLELPSISRRPPPPLPQPESSPEIEDIELSTGPVAPIPLKPGKRAAPDDDGDVSLAADTKRRKVQPNGSGEAEAIVVDDDDDVIAL